MKKIGINLRAKQGLSDEDYIKLIGELGFDTVFSMVWGMEESLKTAELLAKEGLTYDTLHSPYKKINDMWKVGEDGDAMYASLTNSVDTCVAVGAPIVVVHLSSGQNPPPPTDVGRGRYIDLVEYAAKKNIKVAFENQRMLGNIGWAFEEFKNAENVGFCWDCGHEACFTPGIEYMPMFGKRLICTHIHDNDGVFNHDQHRLPFDGGGVNYQRYANYMRKSSYNGALMLEVEGDNEFYADITCEEFLRRAAEKIKKLREMCG